MVYIMECVTRRTQQVGTVAGDLDSMNPLMPDNVRRGSPIPACRRVGKVACASICVSYLLPSLRRDRVQPVERSSYLLAQARAHDPDRFLAGLFAPAERRETVLALVLLNHELARVPDLVSQPMAGLIRYQWWRDALGEIAVGGGPRRHPVVESLAASQAHGWLDLAALQSLIDARERRLEDLGVRDLEALEAYVRDTSGLLQAEIHRALGGPVGPAREAAREIGTGVGLVGLVRASAIEAERRRALPAELLHAVSSILELGASRIAAGRAAAGRPPRNELAAFLPGRLAAAESARLRRLGADPARASYVRRPATAVLGLLAAWLARRP